MTLLYSPDMWITFILFIIALGSCAFFAFLETSIATLRLFTIEELERSVGRYPALFSALRLHRHRVLTTMVIANSGATVIATTFSTRFLLLLFKNSAHHLELPLTLLVSTALMLICGEVIPKHVAKVAGYQLIRYTLWGTNMTYQLLYPLVTLLTALSERVVGYIMRSYALNEPYHEHISREEIQFLINHMHKSGTLSAIQRDLLSRVFSLSTLSVADIMLPLSAYPADPRRATVPHLCAADSVETAAALFSRYKMAQITVHDAGGKIIGVVEQSTLSGLLLGAAAEHPQNSLDRKPTHSVSLHQRSVEPSHHSEDHL